MISFDFNSYTIKTPGYLRCTLPEEVVKEVKKTMKKIDNDKIKTEDNRKNLAGHLQKETTFPITKKLKYVVESLCYEYDSIFLNKIRNKYNHSTEFVKELSEDDYEFKYILRSAWINYSKKHDFNPIHMHTGHYSFVLWVKIPYKLEDEDKMYPCSNGNKSGRFYFVHSEANMPITSVTSTLVDAVEWDLILFPASLNHTVYPFFSTDEERISISGNLYYEPVKVKKK